MEVYMAIVYEVFKFFMIVYFVIFIVATFATDRK